VHRAVKRLLQTGVVVENANKTDDQTKLLKNVTA